MSEIQAITTRGGKTTRDPPYPKGIERRQTAPVLPEEKKDDRTEEIDPPMPELQQDFHDTNFILFPRRVRKDKTDDQFSKFVEVIQKLCQYSAVRCYAGTYLCKVFKRYPQQ
jgi:hypothetical protein